MKVPFFYFGLASLVQAEFPLGADITGSQSLTDTDS